MTMAELQTLARALQPLGFSAYEAKAYATLVVYGAMNGYELAKNSGVPRSMVYETINKLQSRGAIFALAEEPGRYHPLPHEELLGRLRREVDEQLDRAEDSFARIERPAEAEVVWRIDGTALSLEAAEGVVDSARRTLTLSIWQEQLDVLEPALHRAASRGVTIRAMLFGDEAPTHLGHFYLHHFVDPTIVKRRLRSQPMVITADHAEVLVANLGEDETGWAVRTRDRALVLVSEEYVRHDIVLAALAEHVGRDVLDRLWRSRDDLIPMILGADANGEPGTHEFSVSEDVAGDD